MVEMMLTIWLIGWLFACGYLYEIIKDKGLAWPWYVFGFMIIAILWPVFLGSEYRNRL